MNIKKIFAFVVMPFSDEYKNVYELAIKVACDESNVFCQRLDEQIFSESMLNQIYTQIYKSDFIIADMSGKNPNVFYEVGYAHGQNKNVILITNDGNDIPFDFKHYQHIIYNKNNLTELKQKLIERIQFFNGNNSKNNNDFREYILSINGDILEENKCFEITPNMDDEDTLIFNVDIHNPTNRKIIPSDASLNLIIPVSWVNLENNIYPMIDKNHIIMEFGQMPELAPLGYSSEQIYLEKSKKNQNQYYDRPTEIILRIISEYGNFDNKLLIKFNKKQ
jgi:nucleoside 2-deoxyribosyltransferase